MEFTRYEKLEPYEQGVIDHLEGHLGYSRESALQLFSEYEPVWKLINGYYGSYEYAEKFHNARQNGVTSDAWVERIQHIRRVQKKAEIQKRIPRGTRRAKLVKGERIAR